MHARFSILLVIFLLFTSGCSTVRVSQDYNMEADFSRYQSYDWQLMEQQQSGDVRVNNPLLHDRFHQAIDQVLGSRGYRRHREPDFLISYNYSITTRLESDPFSTSFGFGFGTHHRYGGVGINTNTDIRQYDVGVLVIDIHDGATNKLIWRGTGSEIVTTHSTPGKISAMINRMVSEILAQFPPG